jgi:uroporphyrinogen-III synthase
VTVIAIGKQTAKFVKATHTITRSTGQTISLVAALERSYLNP